MAMTEKEWAAFEAIAALVTVTAIKAFAVGLGAISHEAWGPYELARTRVQAARAERARDAVEQGR